MACLWRAWWPCYPRQEEEWPCYFLEVSCLKHETLILILVGVLSLMLGQVTLIKPAFEISEILVALVFSMVFTFAIGLEVVK